MCTFTLELKLCPCKQDRPAQGAQKCVRKSKPFEKYIAPNDTWHALDVQDGIGFAKEYTCARERRKNGQHAEASMLCPDMKWAHGSQQGSRDMVQSTPSTQLCACRQQFDNTSGQPCIRHQKPSSVTICHDRRTNHLLALKDGCQVVKSKMCGLWKGADRGHERPSTRCPNFECKTEKLKGKVTMSDVVIWKCLSMSLVAGRLC
ncbi:hypothetical protein CC79DRAFT_1317508 [Sarocladium strictum]